LLQAGNTAGTLNLTAKGSQLKSAILKMKAER